MRRATARPASLLPLTERQIQAQALDALAWSRFRVLDTVEHIRACPECGHRDYRSGQQRGLPDLLVREDGWARGLWGAIELKTATGRLSIEQRAIHDYGGSYVARSMDEVLEAAAAIRREVRRNGLRG